MKLEHADKEGLLSAASKHYPSRREFLYMTAGAAALGVIGWPRTSSAQATGEWNQGQLTHIIPAVNHERMLIKVSFKTSLNFTPRLSVDGKSVDGTATGPWGRYWRFDVNGLRPATQYELRITDPRGDLCVIRGP